MDGAAQAIGHLDGVQPVLRQGGQGFAQGLQLLCLTFGGGFAGASGAFVFGGVAVMHVDTAVRGSASHTHR